MKKEKILIREKLIEKGPKNLKDEELLAILLRTGTKEKSAFVTQEKFSNTH
jgi:DNA repair protein RadC